MERRRFLRSVGLAVTIGTTGCIGGGGKLVVNIQREVAVRPHTGWITEIPDLSDPGGAISYLARADEPFDVYLFVGEDQLRQYRAFLDGQQPSELPAGNRKITRTATSAGEDMYRATSKDDGGRQPIDATGPYYFVLDNSNYPAAGGAYVDEQARERSIFLDLTVNEKRFGLSV